MAGLKANMWVAVCDGRKALLLQNAGDEKFPKLETRETYLHDNPPTHEQGTDAPGRTFSSASGRKAGMEQTDWHDAAERDFVKGFAEKLSRHAQSGRIGDLLIAAPARALGVLRQSLGLAARCVQAQFEKDYVDMPVFEIERHISKLMDGEGRG